MGSVTLYYLQKVLRSTNMLAHPHFILWYRCYLFTFDVLCNNRVTVQYYVWPKPYYSTQNIYNSQWHPKYMEICYYPLPEKLKILLLPQKTHDEQIYDIRNWTTMSWCHTNLSLDINHISTQQLTWIRFWNFFSLSEGMKYSCSLWPYHQLGYAYFKIFATFWRFPPIPPLVV